MSRWERCKLCGSPDLVLLHDLPRVRVRVVRCRSCDFAFVDELYDEAQAAVLYSQTLGRETEYDRYETGKEGRAAERAGEIADLLDRRGDTPFSGLTVLDVGAGGGSFLAAVRRAGARVRGIELSEAARSFALERHGLRLDPRPIEDPCWDEASVDVLTLWDVLEHVQDPRRTVAAVARVLKPGGLLALTTPARDSSLHALAATLHRLSLGRVDLLLRHRYNRLHLQAFRRSDLESLLEDRGLRIVRLGHRLDLSYPLRWYFREALGRTSGGDVLAALARVVLALAPLENKIVAHAVRARETGVGGGRDEGRTPGRTQPP